MLKTNQVVVSDITSHSTLSTIQFQIAINHQVEFDILYNIALYVCR